MKIRSHFNEWKLETARRARADRNLAERHQMITMTLVFAILWMAAGWLAIRGDERQQARLAEEHTEIRAQELRIKHELRASHPPNIWQRWCEDGLNWSPTRQRCE